MADRHGPLRTPMGQFIASVNGGDIGNGAVVVPLGSDAWESNGDLEAFNIEETSGNLSAVVPTGARGGEGINPEDVMILAGGGAEEATYNLESSGAFVYGGVPWLPTFVYGGVPWNPGAQDGTVSPGPEWFPNSEWIPEDPSDIGVLVPNIEGVMERIGMDELPEGAEMVEEGDTVEAGNILVATFGDEELYSGQMLENPTNIYLPEEPIFPDDPLFPDDPFAPELFDAGTQAPIGGAGFGMGVLSTPSATVAGQDANPIIQVSSEDLLTRDETANLLSNAGISDADSVEWAAGPQPFDYPGPKNFEGTELLGGEAELELFAGVVSGSEAPWGVSLGIVRGTPDDHVIVIGVNRRPVGTGDGGLEAVQNDGHVFENMDSMLADTVPELQSG